MEILFKYNFNIDDLEQLLLANPDIGNLQQEDINKILLILEDINCSPKQIKNILVTNPLVLSVLPDDLLSIINEFKKINIQSINLLLDSNPYLLTINPFDLTNYIKLHLERGIQLDDLISMLELNNNII